MVAPSLKFVLELIVLNGYKHLVLLKEVEQVLGQVDRVEQAQKSTQAHPEVVVPLHFLFHEELANLGPLARGKVGSLLEVVSANFDAIHPHHAVRAEGFLDVQELHVAFLGELP